MAYRTFKRSARNWKEFASARKITVDRGLSYEEARRRCEEFNAGRSTAQIRKGTKLEFDGQVFRDLEATKKYIENEIGKILDSTPNHTPAGFVLPIYKALVENRKRLCTLLSAEYYIDPDEEDEKKSIFEF